MDNLTPYNFFFELPLYTKLELNQENQKDFVGLMSYRGIIDAYNPILKENTSYQVSSTVSVIAGPSGQVSPAAYKDFTTLNSLA